MNVVVTKNKVDYSESFLKLSSLKKVLTLRGTIDTLVFNNSDEDKDTKIACLGELKDRVKKLIYICNEKNTDTAIKMMVIGSDGKYLDDEFFLESSEELSNLVNSLDEVTALANLGGVNVVCDFFNRYLKDGSSSNEFNSNYLSVVKEAVNTMLTEYNEKNLEIIQMSETATSIFSNTSALIASMKKEKDSMEEVVKSMSSRLADPQTSFKRHSGSSVLFYPRVNYMKERSIIRVKEVGSFKFLTSFMLGFRKYLEDVKNVRPKLIFLEPVGEVVESLYKEYNWVKVSTKNSMSNYYNSIVFTNCPSKEVLPKLLDDDKFDTFIVVDRTTSDYEHILNCKGSNVKYAISGNNVLEKFNIPKIDCFTSLVELRGTMFAVPLYQDYPSDKSARERFYISNMGSFYDKLLIGLRRR